MVLMLQRPFFRIYVLRKDTTKAGGWDPVDAYCKCPLFHGADGTTVDRVFGAVVSTSADGVSDVSPTGLFHECRLCSGQEFRKTNPLKRQVCGAVTHTCARCLQSTGHSNAVRSRDATRCVSCPRAHIANRWIFESTHSPALSTRKDSCFGNIPCELSLYEQLELAAHRYQWTFDTDMQREHALEALQSFASGDGNTRNDVYSHIQHRFLEGGGWTCHLCPVGFVFVQDITSAYCRPLNLVTVKLDSNQDWTLSASCVDPATGCDEYTDELRTRANIIPVRSFLIIDLSARDTCCRVPDRRKPCGGPWGCHSSAASRHLSPPLRQAV